MVVLHYEYPQGSGTVADDVAIDASIYENHAITAEVTQHQVERGSPAGDHIRPLPRRLSLQGLISNVPIVIPLTQSRGVNAAPAKTKVQAADGSVIQFTTLQFDGLIDRSHDVFGSLVPAALNGALFTITTSLTSYENFAITSFNVPRNADIGDDLQFSIEFQEVRIVEALTVAALSQRPSTKKKPDNKGTKTPKSAEDDRSLILKAAQDWFGVFK